ncbi:MAG: hypothetical protein AB1546_05900 [bacterium]
MSMKNGKKMKAYLKKLASDAVFRMREASRKAHKLEEMAQKMQFNQGMIGQLQEANRKSAKQMEELREQVATIVELAGGTMNLPGYPRALHFKQSVVFEWDSESLLSWLKGNAPQFCIEVREERIDREGLRRCLEVRDGKPFLNGVDEPVGGVAVKNLRSVVIPSRIDS